MTGQQRQVRARAISPAADGPRGERSSACGGGAWHRRVRRGARECANARQRRRRMAQERIEDDLGCASVCGGVGVFDAIDLRRSRSEASALPDAVRTHSGMRTLGTAACAIAARRAPPGAPLRPVAVSINLFDGLLAKVVQLAHWHEQIRAASALRVDRAEHERRVAEAAELFAQLGVVERAFARGCERDIRSHGDRFVARSSTNRLERRARGAEHADVEARFLARESPPAATA